MCLDLIRVSKLKSWLLLKTTLLVLMAWSRITSYLKTHKKDIKLCLAPGSCVFRRRGSNFNNVYFIIIFSW